MNDEKIAVRVTSRHKRANADDAPPLVGSHRRTQHFAQVRRTGSARRGWLEALCQFLTGVDSLSAFGDHVGIKFCGGLSI